MNKNRLIFISFLAVLVLATLACESNIATSVPSPIIFTEPLPPTSTPKVKPTRCIPASSAQVEIIRIGVKGIQESNHIQSVWAVRSNDYERVWFVAAEIVGPGIQPKQAIGLWAIPGELEQPSAGAWSVNGFALEFSDWANGPNSDANLSMYDDGAQEAILCASTP